jgi:hypothetical protein
MGATPEYPPGARSLIHAALKHTEAIAVARCPTMRVLSAASYPKLLILRQHFRAIKVRPHRSDPGCKAARDRRRRSQGRSDRWRPVSSPFWNQVPARGRDAAAEPDADVADVSDVADNVCNKARICSPISRSRASQNSTKSTGSQSSGSSGMKCDCLRQSRQVTVGRLIA